MNAALRAAEALFAPHGITVGEFDVLAALRRGGAGTVLTPTTLARVAMISPAGMTNRLNRLEAAGLIVRRPDPDDRRGSLVELTPNGHAVADRAVEDLVAAENEFFAELSAPNDNASTASSTSSSNASSNRRADENTCERQATCCDAAAPGDDVGAGPSLASRVARPVLVRMFRPGSVNAT